MPSLHEYVCMARRWYFRVLDRETSFPKVEVS